MKHTKYRYEASTHKRAHAGTHTILTRNSFPNSSWLWAWITLISPLPFSKLWLASLLVPLGLTYDTFYITHSHLPQKYWKDVLPKHWSPAARILHVTNQYTKLWTFFVLLICSNPFWVFFAGFQNTLCSQYPSTFQKPTKRTVGTTNPASQALWWSDTSSWLHIRSCNCSLCTIIYWWSQITQRFALDEPNLSLVRLIYLRLLRWPSCCRFGYKQW